jgi:hypothetical protein
MRNPRGVREERFSKMICEKSTKKKVKKVVDKKNES